ncbi:hypothetical protein HA402_015175 [Bradysia odoriphaga]|nr:hypothetical protein HA402_015175 [Bradysia odoriphaga]
MKFVVALLGVLFLAVTADAGASMHNPFYCYATDPIRPMTNMASVFTSYEAIRRFNFTTVNPYRSTCTPSRFWYMGRYGARFPHPIGMQEMIDFAESSVQDDIVRNYEAGRTSLCREDFELIRDFSMESDFASGFHLGNASLVTDSGIIGIQNIASRYQENFPNIFPTTYSPERFLFRHTESVRTNQSARAFASGLFGAAGAQNVVYEEVPERDWFLRPFDFCPAFNDEVSDWNAQQNAFRDGPEMQELIDQVNRRLGFHADQLNFQQIFDMWNWCRFKTAAYFEESGSETGTHCPWCAAFSVAHHLILEYWEDLGHFYFSGYGVRNQRLLENLNCGVMQDLINHMQSDSPQVARIYMSYTQEVQLLLVLLGSFRDTWPLHQHNYAQQSARNWLTSLIAPFGSNLAVVRHDCDDGDHDLIFYLNERPILVPGCDQQNGVCKLSVIVERFQRFVGVNCEEVFCSNL